MASRPEDAPLSDETSHEEFFLFLRYLNRLPHNEALPEGFHEKWDKELRRLEQEEIAKLPAKNRSDDQVAHWVKRAWITTEVCNTEKEHIGHFKYQKEKPDVGEHPIPVVLTLYNGRWRMPEDQMLAARQHPIIRAFCESLPPLTDKASILSKMEWAIDLGGVEDSPEQELCNSALTLYSALCSDVRECMPATLSKCIPFDHLPENAPLWKLLDAAIGFGRRLQHQEIFGDGSVDSILNKGIISDIDLSPREAIARLMDDYFNEKGIEATSMSLLEWMKAVRPHDDNKPIVFPDARGDALRNIKWEHFDQTLKNEKKSRKRQG